METLRIVLRLIHIIGGVFWVGGALALTFFVSPTAAAIGEAGQKFMGYLLTQSRFVLTITIAGISTVLAGFALYGMDSAGFPTFRAWTESSFGTALGIGAVFALIGLYFGIQVPRLAGAMGKFAAQIQGAPSAEQMAHLQAMRKKLMRVSKTNAISLIIATCFMATARYLHF